MRVIGTAGHVDHGKSTLVQALTGTHPDRLKEEREREMTIDLGFAFFNLPEGEEVGIVDVPGHRDFIENMLAGVGGIDAALFVVAADEGVMPQTREHLAILHLLDIGGGVVALTKTDLVEGPEWISLVEEELRQTLAGTVLETAPIIKVSARRREGLEALVNALSEALGEKPPRPDFGRPRLPIDRVFSVAGFGTVVTGTLLDGSLQVGDEVQILPGGQRGRVRGLQTHNRKAEVVPPGGRTAVNISGVGREEVRRGEWVVRAGAYPSTRRLDLQFSMLPDAAGPLKHDAEVKFFIGAAEIMGRARVLGVEQIDPGGEGWIQVELADPVVARRGDRYILRRPSPGETIGGGGVLDPEPRRRHRRFSTSLLARLEALAAGSPEDVFLHAAAILGAAPLKRITAASGLDEAAVSGMLPELVSSGSLIMLEPGGLTAESSALAVSAANWARIRARILDVIGAFHTRQPLRPGIPREELRSKVGETPSAFNASLRLLAEEGRVLETGSFVANAGHEIRFSSAQKQLVAGLVNRFAADPFGTPSVKESIAAVGEDVYDALLALGDLVQVSPDVVFRKEDYDLLVTTARQMMAGGELLTVSDFRDRIGSTRKYVLAFLEHLDVIGVTVRVGDGRRLKTQSS